VHVYFEYVCFIFADFASCLFHRVNWV